MSNATPQQRSSCICGQICNCACHQMGTGAVKHELPCCGPGSANHYLYCENGYQPGNESQKGGN
ncbi:MAG: hypothetical protein P4K83_02230 [Terracidiphilus sp.]|nr:hypothetical protein [Terracidiphilus sp.]